jgi:hypothetical protein
MCAILVVAGGDPDQILQNNRGDDIMSGQFTILVDPENSVDIPSVENGCNPKPMWARIFEISLSISAPKIELGYSHLEEFAVSDQNDFEKQMSALVLKGSHHGTTPKPRDVDTNGDPIGSSLSVNWQHYASSDKGIAYLVFRLSSDFDWQFNEFTVPFSMHKDDLPYCRFAGGGKFAADGAHVDPSKKLSDCRYAYFIVNGPNLPGNLPGQGPQDFIRPFNMHIELLERGNVTHNRIPIIIDPDVRNPGGSGG